MGLRGLLLALSGVLILSAASAFSFGFPAPAGSSWSAPTARCPKKSRSVLGSSAVRDTVSFSRLCPQMSRVRAAGAQGLEMTAGVASAEKMERPLMEEVIRDASPPKRIAVVGTGPTGLATAIMLARRGWKGITVFDRLPRLEKPDAESWKNQDRAYGIGISARGQTALTELDCLERIRKYAVPVKGQKNWNPGSSEPQFVQREGRIYSTIIIERDRLAACLLEEAEEKYSDAIKVEFRSRCLGINWEEGPDGPASLRVQRMPTIEGGSSLVERLDFDFVVGADGINSVIRDEIEDQGADRLFMSQCIRVLTRITDAKFKVTRYEDRPDQIVYKTIVMSHLPGDPKDITYSARSEEGITMQALPTKDGTLNGVVLFKPDDERVLSAKTGAEAKQMFGKHLPMFDGCFTDEALEQFAQKNISKFAKFQYCGKKVHYGTSTVVLGDAIHSVKPFFGLGVNSAFEDITELSKCLDKSGGELKDALPLYSSRRGQDAKALVEVSRAYNRPGFFMFVSFILPLILDRFFTAKMPWLFAGTFLDLCKDPNIRFSQAQRRKQIDRTVQALLVSAVLWALGAAIVSLIKVGRAALVGA